MTSPVSKQIPSKEDDLVEKRQHLDEEIQMLGRSFLQLKEVQEKFVQNIFTLSSLKSAEEGQTIMVPLTSSLYTFGRLASNEKVLVDVGTGYFVQKDTSSADAYYTRRIKFIQEQLSSISQMISEKRKEFSVLANAVQTK